MGEKSDEVKVYGIRQYIDAWQWRIVSPSFNFTTYSILFLNKNPGRVVVKKESMNIYI